MIDDAFIQEVRNARSLQEKSDLLYQCCAGEDCFIIATGPSAGEFDPDELREVMTGRPVMAVKAAYQIVPELVRCHLNNPVHYFSCDYGDHVPLRFSSTDGRDEKWNESQDLSFTTTAEFPITRGWARSTVSSKKNFADWEISKKLERPLGPGIMEELGFYLAVHIGCSRLFTLGYDLGGYSHFYEPGKMRAKKSHDGLICGATPQKIKWLKSHGIDWFRVASSLESPIPAPTIELSDI